jgi:cation diffusion facilitator CzcD-associated flavoprotein CzcO
VVQSWILTACSEALAEPNCDVIFDPIVRFTEKGIETADGKEHEYDAISTQCPFYP